MGLDMNPMSKPKPGHEAEFRDIFLRLEIVDGKRPDPKDAGKGFFARLFSPRADRAPLLAQFQAISVLPSAAIGAPVVGQDEAADDWVRQHFADGQLKGATTEAEALTQLAGCPVLQVMPDCDGFPVYTHAYQYDGVDRTSFRGKFLKLCKPVIGDDLLNRAWTNMLAEELSDWAAGLREAVDAYAAREGVAHVLGVKTQEFEDIQSPAAKAHIVDQAARWARFWAERGHGSEAYY